VKNDRSLFAGLDWASKTHAVCVVDDHGQIVMADPEGNELCVER